MTSTIRTRAVVIERTGGPEVLLVRETDVPPPGPGEARVRQSAVGVNFVDTYQRSGLYPVPLPATLGSEAAGVVEDVGPGVDTVKPGDRVAYAGGPPGAYAGARRVAAERLVPLPDDVDARLAAAMMLRGMTAEYLLCRTFRVKPGDTILFHAAAGGVGLIACQWARALGATVIGTVGSDAKAALARGHGCGHVIVTSREDIAARVREITGGAGVAVAYDSVGKDTWDASLDSLAPRGTMVSFGNASGPVPPVAPLVLMTKGSLFLTRPTLNAYIATRVELLASAQALFDVVRRGVVRIEVGQEYPLDAAADAHRALEARRTTGSTILRP